MFRLRPFFQEVIAKIAIHKLVQMYVFKNVCKRKIRENPLTKPFCNIFTLLNPNLGIFDKYVHCA